MQIRLRAARTSTSSTTDREESLDEYGLGGYDCELCGNRGRILETRHGYLEARECSCMAIRRSMRNIAKSGLLDMLERYSFDNYDTPDATRKKLKETALKFSTAQQGWFYISGNAGSGKTHLCSAICSELIKAGHETLYMMWRDEVTKLKAGITDKDWYENRIQKLKTVPVLYIDDFFKGRITDADVNLIFEIINARYNKLSLRTIISSELSLNDVLNIDEAVGSRIYERARGYNVKAPNENWRLK